MLILTRYPTEKVVFDFGKVRAVITIVGAGTSRNVTLGIEAPPEVRVLRGELLTKEQQEQRQ